MPELVVLSGKGGTGKTSVCAALAHLAPNCLICDLDVDTPDLHILLDPKPQQHELFRSGSEAVIDQARCLHCGRCEQFCQFGGIQEQGGVYTIDPLHCEGCAVCARICPGKAIRLEEKTAGEWSISETRFGPLVHALLYPGQENSGKLVSLLKQMARQKARAENKDWILCDGSPGVGCPVISSLSGADLAIAVVEPTPSGEHDFIRLAELCVHFHIPIAVVINKADLHPARTEKLRVLGTQYGGTIVGELPFDTVVTTAMIQRKALTEIESPFAQTLCLVWENIVRLSQNTKKGKGFIPPAPAV